MITTAIHLGLSLLIPFTAGYLCLQLLFQKQALPISLKISLSYGLGLGLLAIWMLILYIYQQPFNLFIIRTPLLFFIIFLFLINFKKGTFARTKTENKPASIPTTTPKHLFINSTYIAFIALLILYIAFNIYYVFWRSLTVPLSSWDAIATIAFKAKIFFFEPSPPSLELLPHHSYPLFVPFVQSWIAFNLGYWSGIFIKVIFPFAFLAYLTIHYKFLVYFCNKTWALLGCAILLSSNFLIHHATVSYRDFFIMYFNCATILLLVLWHQKKAVSFLILAGLYAGITTFTKLEGTGYLVIHTLMVIFILWRNSALSLGGKVKEFFKFAIPSYAICLIYHFYKINLGISGMEGRIEFAISPEHLSRLPVIMSDFASILFLSGNWNIIWFLLCISLLFHCKIFWHSMALKLLAFPLLMFFVIYFTFLTFTSAEMVNVSFGLLSRVILHFYPLSVLLIILLNDPNFPDSQNNVNSKANL